MCVHVRVRVSDLEHNGVDAGELGLLSVQVLYGALEQQHFGVLDVRVHLISKHTRETEEQNRHQGMKKHKKCS